MQESRVVLRAELTDRISKSRLIRCTIGPNTRAIMRIKIAVGTNARDVDRAGDLLCDRGVDFILKCDRTQAYLVQVFLKLCQIKVLGRVSLHTCFKLRVITLDIFHEGCHISVL